MVSKNRPIGGLEDSSNNLIKILRDFPRSKSMKPILTYTRNLQEIYSKSSSEILAEVPWKCFLSEVFTKITTETPPRISLRISARFLDIYSSKSHHSIEEPDILSMKPPKVSWDIVSEYSARHMNIFFSRNSSKYSSRLQFWDFFTMSPKMLNYFLRGFSDDISWNLLLLKMMTFLNNHF